MAGGVFPGRPFSLNVKCVVASAAFAAGYWFLPPKNLWVLGGILYVTYLALAWYDYAYDCADRMHPTLFPFGRLVYLPLKPPDYQAEYEAMTPDQKRRMDQVDHMAVFIVLGGLGYLAAKAI